MNCPDCEAIIKTTIVNRIAKSTSPHFTCPGCGTKLLAYIENEAQYVSKYPTLAIQELLEISPSTTPLR